MKNLEELNNLSEIIIGSAIEVHRNLGPGLLESVYEKAILIELKTSGLAIESQKDIPIDYKGKEIGRFRADIIVEDSIVVELKSVERIDPLFEAQLLSYMKLGNYPLGLLLNFNTRLLKNGIKRVILTNTNIKK